MICSCCIRVAREELENAGCKVSEISLGRAVIEYDEKKISLDGINEVLSSVGMALIAGREEQIVENIKQAVIELIHQLNNVNSLVRRSDYLVEKLNMNYQSMSKLFSKHESITLEKYIIHQKIERIKELIDSDEYSLSEIAYMMDYSSVHYLSNQFKKITGVSVTDYKNSEQNLRKSIGEV